VPLDERGKIAVDALISLSPLGGERLGAFLPVISAGAVPANSTKIRAVIQGTPRKPEIRWSRAG